MFGVGLDKNVARGFMSVLGSPVNAKYRKLQTRKDKEKVKKQNKKNYMSVNVVMYYHCFYLYLDLLNALNIHICIWILNPKWAWPNMDV